jgi:hypothetical protein
MVRQSLLHFHLQGAVFRVASGVAPHDNAVAPVEAAVPIEAAVAELREWLEGRP